MNAIQINNWSVCSRTDNPYQAPEQGVQVLSGIVFDHPSFPDEEAQITTSRIIGKRDQCVVTKSGTMYRLGLVDTAYENAYANAFNRLMNSLPEV